MVVGGEHRREGEAGAPQEFAHRGVVARIDGDGMAAVLQFAAEPPAVLREVDRVMMPEGRLIIVGFNPWSLWGLRSAVGPSRESYPWNGRFVSLLRVKDWLALLGFDVSAGRLTGYAPPFDSEKLRSRFGFMEPAGDRWWAVGGAVYMLQAIKRVRGMRLLTPAWQGE